MPKKRGTDVTAVSTYDSQPTSHGAPLVGFSPSSRWLPSVCGCQRHIVAALQCDIYDGVATSCGYPGCDGVMTPVIVGTLNAARIVTDDNFDAFVEKFIADNMAPSDVITVRRGKRLMHVIPLECFEERHPEAVEKRAHRVAWRREDVLLKWREGKQPNDIAKELDLPYYVVVNDLQWLLTKGRMS